jgi:hypothetical protein
MKRRSILISAVALLVAVFSASVFAGIYSGGSGEPNDPYQIGSAQDLLALAADTNDYNKCFILTADINMQDQVFTTAIIAKDTVASIDFDGTAFTGTFDGNGHKIMKFKIYGEGENGNSYYIGLFGYIDSGSSIKNLGLENFYVSGGGSINFSWYVGGLVGYSRYGIVSNCYSTGSVGGFNAVGGLVGDNYEGSISNCYSTGSVSGLGDYVGGLVGGNYEGSISSCYSTGTTNGSYKVGGLLGGGYHNSIVNCYSTGSVVGLGNYVGGLVGYNNEGDISNCYSTGSVGGTGDYVGGLVGYNPNGSVSSSYFLLGAGPENGYGEPLTDGQMKQQASFVGWDFVGETANGTEDIWRMCIDGVNYPLQWWQFNMADFTCPDGVDFIDFAILANAWLSDSVQANWNSRCDIGEPPDNVINILDLAIFTQHWLEEI